MVGALTILLACDETPKGDEDTAQDSGETPAATCQPYDGPGTELPWGWHAWAEELQAEFERTGICPTTLDQVAWSDGCLYEPLVEVVDTQGVMLVRWAHDISWDYLYLTYATYEFTSESCEATEQPSEPVDGQIGGDAWWNYQSPAPPSFLHSGEGYAAGIFAFAEGDATARVSTSPAGAYFWLCVEEAEPVDGYEPGPAAARGTFFVHVERWDEGEGDVPADYLIRFDHNDCMAAEDARGLDCDAEFNMCWWPEHCDGIDNDLDGIVDEGAQDCDGSGVPDCQEYDASEAPRCAG